MSTAGDPIATAVRLHQSGQLQEAEALYRQVLAKQPEHPDALHFLGLIAHQRGRHDEAIQLMGRAIVARPISPVIQCSLGDVYRAQGMLSEAIACYQRAMAMAPQLPAAHYNLGLALAVTDPAAAAPHFENAIRLAPTNALAHLALGNMRRQLNQSDAAIASYRRVLELQPQNPDALINLGATLVELGRQDEAVPMLQQAAALVPQAAIIPCYLGLACRNTNDLAQAIEHFRNAVRLQPNFIEARYHLASSMRLVDEIESASAEYRTILDLQPNHLETLIDCSTLLQAHGCHAESLSYLERAIRARPDSAPAHYYRGIALCKLKRESEAVIEFHEALRIQPDYPQGHANLAAIYSKNGQPDEVLRYCREGLAAGVPSVSLYDYMALASFSRGHTSEAIACYRKSVELEPSDAAIHSNLIYVLNFDPNLSTEDLFEEHLAWAKRHAEPLTALAPANENEPSPERRLRIGYVSPHFRQHAVNYFTEPILLAHDHEQVEIFCYSSVTHPDDTTARLKEAADHWRDVQELSDEEVAQLVREDRIDILVDLSGHMGINRLLLFARKPAPVQVTYIGYQNTTGMSAMDYRLTDEQSDPIGQTDRFYTEQLVRLPRSYFCYKPTPAPDVVPCPSIANGYVTFGSFNNYAKVNSNVVRAWIEILARVPDSHIIVLGYTPGYLENHWRSLAAERDIGAERIEIVNRCPRENYLKLIERTDIALDPFPANGHTTTCDALWMGVPVVNLAGHTYISRYGGTVLKHVGLEDLITQSVNEYIEKAVQLAGDLDRLTELRHSLRQAFAESVLMDAAGFTRNLESSYREMWRTWCRQRGN